MSGRTYNGRGGITAEFHRRCAGEPRTKRITEEQVREIVRDELLCIMREAASE